MKIGFLRKTIKTEEKLLLEELRKRNIEIIDINDRELVIDSQKKKRDFPFDVIIERCRSHDSTLHFLHYFKNIGIPTINTYEVANICGDKIYTSNRLKEANIPQPKYGIAADAESALELIEEFGYPCVIKPTTGSWGRLIGKVTDRHSAEMVIEHKMQLGSYHHHVFYIQEFIKKPKKRDIRSFVIGNKCIAAIYRTSDHWITNTAQGGKATNCPINKDLEKICLDTAKAVGDGVIGIDLFEIGKNEYLVNEVNYTIEFRNSIEPTGVDIPKKYIDYVVKVAEKNL